MAWVEVYGGQRSLAFELTTAINDRFQTLCNNSQQQATTCKRGRKRTQRVTSNNVGSYWPTMLRPFARGFKLLTWFVSVPVLCWLWFQSILPVSTETRPTTHLRNIHSGNSLVFSINKHMKSTIPLSLYTNLCLGLWNIKRNILLTGHIAINEITTGV